MEVARVPAGFASTATLTVDAVRQATFDAKCCNIMYFPMLPMIPCVHQNHISALALGVSQTVLQVRLNVYITFSMAGQRQRTCNILTTSVIGTRGFFGTVVTVEFASGCSDRHKQQHDMHQEQPPERCGNYVNDLCFFVFVQMTY